MASCPNPNANNQTGSSNMPGASPSKIFSYYKLSRYNRLIDSIIGDIFRNYVSELGWTVKDLENPDNLRRVYKGVKQYMQNMLINKYQENPGEWSRLSDAVAADIDTIIENFSAFADEHIRFSQLFNTKAFDLNEEVAEDDDAAVEEEVEGVAEDIDEEEQEVERDKFDERTSNSQSQIDLASSAIRSIFRLISKAQYNPLTKKGEVAYDKDGLPQPAEFVKTWNLLAERLAGEKNEGKFIEILTSEKTKQIIPEVDQIIDILKLDKKDKSYSETNQFIQFWQSFSKPKIALKSAIFGPSEEGDKQSSFSTYDEIRGNRKKLETIFNSNFASNKIPEDYKQYVKRSTTGVYMLDKTSPTDNKFVPPMDNTFESQLKFLNFLGFQFTFLNIVDQKELDKFKETVSTSAQRLYSSVKNRLNDGSQIKTPLDDLRKKFNKIPGEGKAIRDLIEWESQYSQISPTHSSRTADGEMQYLINNDSALSVANYHLNSSPTLEELFKTPSFRSSKYNPLFTQSWFINFLFDEDGKKREGRTVDLNLISGFKLKEGNKLTVQLERNLSERNKLIQDYNMFLTVGRTDTMRTETSRSFFSVGAYDRNDPVAMLGVKGFSGGFTNNRGFNSLLLKYLNGEIARINSFKKKKQENPSLPSGYGEFSIFSELSQSLKEKLKASPTIVYADPIFKEFLSEYGRILERELNSFRLLLGRNNIKPVDLLSKQLLDIGESIDTMHRAFIAGTVVQSIEFTILYAADPLFYENEKKGTSEMAKRLKGLASTGNVAADLSAVRSYLSGDEEKNYRDRYSIGGALNVQRRDNTESYKSQTISEPISTKNGYTSPSMVTNMKKSWMLRDGRSISDEEIRNLIKEGSEIKVADGQGWVDIDSWREFAIRFGFITPQMEAALRYEGLIFKRDISPLVAGKAITPDEERELQSLEKAIYANPDIYTIPVIKGTYWGPIINSTVDGKAYDKFSIAPLLPSHVKNHPELRDFMIDLVKGQYGYVKYESGTKGWKTQPTASLKGATPDLLATQLFKEQIKTKNKQSTAVTLLTQEVKLAFTNLFNGGKGVSDRVQNIYDKYLSIFQKIKKEQREAVGDDLGMTINEDENKYDITDPEKLSNKLIREIKRQGGDSDLIKAVSINPATGNFYTPLDASGYQKEINQLVSGILDRTLRRFKFAGGDFTLVSNHMQSPLKWYQFSEKGTRPMDVKLTLSKQYSKLLSKLHPDGEKIATLSRLNKLLKNEEWVKENQKALTVMIGRAPVDGPHSTGVGVVAEFYSPTMGNIITVPEEMIFQASWDFDYDKIRVVTPYLDEKGNYLTASHQERRNQIQDQVTELEKSFPELSRLAELQDTEEVPDDEAVEYDSQLFIDKLFNTSARRDMFLAQRENRALIDEYFSLLRESSNLRNNSIIEAFTDATLLPEMYAELVSPNTTTHIKDIALRNGENTKSSIELPRLGRNMYYSEQLKIFKTFFDNKNLLAAFAYDNAFQQLLTYADVNMNEVYNTQKFRMWKKTKINNLLLTEDEHNQVVKGGKILSSLRDDLQKYAKQRWNSEGLNATVDAAKDPFAVLLGITLQNIGVVNVLKHQGVPFERIVRFISHPSLQYYFKLMESGIGRQQALEKLNRDRLFLRSVNKTKRWIDKNDYNSYMTLPKEELRLFKLLQPDQEFRVYETPEGPQVEFTNTIYPNNFTLLDIFSQIDNKERIDKNGYSKEGDLINLNKHINYNQMTSDRLKFLSNPDNDRLVVRQTPARKDEVEGIFSDELRIVSHFFALEKVAWAMRDFRNYFNFDTRKTSTLTDIYSKERLKDRVLDQDLFDGEAMKNMEERTIHGSYMNNDLIAGVFRKIFPFLANPTVLNTFSNIAGDYDKNYTVRNKRDLRNLPYVINNDFISSVLFNYATFNGQNIFDRGFSLLIRQDNSETMSDKLEAFKSQPFYNDLSRTYPILDLLITNKKLFQSIDDPNGLPSSFLLENIQFLKNAQETPMEKEAWREQLRDLYYNYEGENTEEVKNFLNDLFITGLVQSGFNKSFISFAEYIPYDFKQPLIYSAIKEMGKLTGDQLAAYMYTFGSQFRHNNPRYFPKLPIIRENGRPGTKDNPVKYSDRFKYYRQINPPTPPVNPENETVSPQPPVNPDDVQPSDTQLDAGGQPIQLDCP